MMCKELARTGVRVSEAGKGRADYYAGPLALRKSLDAGALFIDTRIDIAPALTRWHGDIFRLASKELPCKRRNGCLEVATPLPSNRQHSKGRTQWIRTHQTRY